MKIIRKGEPWSTNVECSDCKSLLLLEENDVVIRWADDPRPTQSTHDYYFDCAVCNNSNILSLTYVPEHVRQLAMQRDNPAGKEISTILTQKIENPRNQEQLCVAEAEEFCRKHGIRPGYRMQDAKEGPSVFSGVSITGKLICHPEGEPDMQSSWVLTPQQFAKEYLLRDLH